MLTVSPALAAAIESRDQSVSVRVWVDWDKDGFGGKGTLDDLSDHVAGVTIDRSLAGEFPEAARVIDGEAAATLTVDLAKGDTFDDRKSAAWWFSTVNPLSPLAGKRRKARPVVVDVGYKTNGPESDADGMEWVRVFTGTTRNIDVSSADGTAELTALDWRTRLSYDVSPPAMDTSQVGLTPSWLVSYALYQGGIVSSAGLGDGCRFWMPLHGSMLPMLGSVPASVPEWEKGCGVFHSTEPDAGLDFTDYVRPEFGPGPITTPALVMPRQTVDNQYTAICTGDLADGPPMSVYGSAQGRMEGWFRWSLDGYTDAYNAPIYFTVETFTTRGVINAGFEAGNTDGWTADGGTLDASTDYAYDSTYSGKLTPTGSASIARAIASSVRVDAASMTWSVYVYSPTGVSQVSADIDWLTADGTYVSTKAGSTVAIPAGEWTQLSVSGAAPDNAFRGAGKVSVRGTPPSSAVIYIDGADFAFTDGSSMDTSILTYLYMNTTDGIPHGRTSNIDAVPGYADMSVGIPKDGQWHFLGMHWDMENGGRMKIVIDDHEEVFEQNWPTAGPSSGTAETAAVTELQVMVDAADFRVSACDWDTPWANQRPPGAVIDASTLDIQAVTNTDPQEAWSLVSDLAESEQAVVYWTPGTLGSDPVFNYRTRYRLTSDQGQTVQQEITSESSLIDLQMEDGTDQTANRVTIDYTAEAVQTRVSVYRSTDTVLLHLNSVTTWDIAFDNPVVDLLDTTHPLEVGDPDAPFTGYVRLNTKSDGSGTAVNLPVQIVSWNSKGATLQALNRNLYSVYVTVPQNAPEGTQAIELFGNNVTETTGLQAVQESAPSIEEYGPLPLPISGGAWVQTETDALGVAMGVLGDLAEARPVITGMPTLGDPRRELGDRATVKDKDGVGLNDDYWISAIRDEIAPGSYTQQLSARKASSLTKWADAVWGEDVIWK